MEGFALKVRVVFSKYESSVIKWSSIPPVLGLEAVGNIKFIESENWFILLSLINLYNKGCEV